MKKAKKKPGKAKKLTDVEVTVTVDGETLTVEPLTARIKKSGEQVKWTCVGGRMDIAFDKDMSPFFDGGFSAPGSKTRKRKSVSGEPTVLLAAGQVRTFNYTITMYPTGGEVVTIDPQVEVNDPGSPGGSGGHGASGPSASNSGSGSKKKAARKKK